MHQLEALRAVLHAEQVPRLDKIAGHVETPTVDRDVAMEDHLPGGSPRGGEPDPVDDVVEPALEQRHQRLARIPLPPRGTGEVGAELTLEHAVIVLHLLLLAQMKTVLGRLRAALLHHARRRRATLERALTRIAATALEEELEAVTATKAANRPGDASHGFPIGMLADRSRGDSGGGKRPV